MPNSLPNPLDKREFVMPGTTVTVGKYCARASRTMALAARTLAAAAAMFWFEILSFSSSSFSGGSLYLSHHLPCPAASLGCAVFQAPSTLGAPSSLYAGGTGAEGILYLGPTLQAVNSTAAATSAALAIREVISRDSLAIVHSPIYTSTSWPG